MKSINEIRAILLGSTGTNGYHKYSDFRHFPVATDGVMDLAEAAECFWLLDVIGSHQTNRKLDPVFQVWMLSVNKEDDSAVVRGFNDTTLIVTKEIPYTDFPLDSVKLYVENGVLLLPSEH